MLQPACGFQAVLLNPRRSPRFQINHHHTGVEVRQVNPRLLLLWKAASRESLDVAILDREHDLPVHVLLPDLKNIFPD